MERGLPSATLPYVSNTPDRTQRQKTSGARKRTSSIQIESRISEQTKGKEKTMATITSSLTHTNDTQSSLNEKKSGRGMISRQMILNLLINAAAPFAINIVAQNYMPSIDALLLASAAPALSTLVSLVWKRRIDLLGASVVLGLLLSAVFALLLNSPRLLLLQHSAVSGLFGVMLLLSLFFPRPGMFYLARSIMAQHDPQRLARMNASWELPQVRSFYRVLSAVWGCVTLVQVIISAVLCFILPIPMMLAISPFLSIAFVIPAAHWSMHYSRKHRSQLAQLHQRSDAIAATSGDMLAK
jgi:hypothetical protein